MSSVDLALKLLLESGLPLLSISRLLLEINDVWKKPGVSLETLREVISLGVEQYELKMKSCTLLEIRDLYLNSKPHLRARTKSDINQLTNRVLRSCPELENRLICDLSVSDWESLLQRTFSTLRQRYKAQSVFGALMEFARRRGWVKENVFRAIELPKIVEQEVPVLRVSEVRLLLKEAGRVFEGACLPAVALMVFAGIRPEEVKRLTWNQIQWEDRVIVLRPKHSKTGGARQVSLSNQLRKFLICHGKKEGLICPVQWCKKWRYIRERCGWGKEHPWPIDCLRHTYASYHLKRYKDLSLLQVEMGHSSLSMLRTRYLNLSGVTQASAREFWNIGV